LATPPISGTASTAPQPDASRQIQRAPPSHQATTVLSAVAATAAAIGGCPTGDDDDSAGPDGDPLALVAVTFNTGTSENMGHDGEPDDGYSSWHASMSDQHYGDGLAWVPAVEAATAFLADVAPDVIALQEIFFSDECADVPEEAWTDFVCADWQAGDPTVAQVVLGEGYQVMCHPGKSDKCAAVRLDFGAFAGCDEEFCLEGLEGGEVDDCGSGSRVGRGLIELVDGGELTLVSVHSSSGMAADDMDCRVKQVEQVFVDLGDGEPAANGARNLILGDFNTDPGRLTETDPSAARWADFVDVDGSGDQGFHFVTDVGPDAPPTYATLLNIDHVVSDVATGSCWHAGTTEGLEPVIDAIYFDHRPAVCALELPR
jgi:hypothetical protein